MVSNSGVCRDGHMPPGRPVIWGEASVGLVQVFLEAGYEWWPPPLRDAAWCGDDRMNPLTITDLFRERFAPRTHRSAAMRGCADARMRGCTSGVVTIGHVEVLTASGDHRNRLDRQ
jgi:hypothetical protein